MHPAATEQLTLALVGDEAEKAAAIVELQLGDELLQIRSCVTLACDEQPCLYPAVAQRGERADHQVDALVRLESPEVQRRRLVKAWQRIVGRIEIEIDAILDDGN